jgi:ABC-type lipoprotein release transport system permease subunit
MNILALKTILCNSKRSLHIVIAVMLSVSIIYSSFIVADGFVRRVEMMTGGYTVTDLLFVIDEKVSLIEAKIPQSILDYVSSFDNAHGVVRCIVSSKDSTIEIYGVNFEEFSTVRNTKIIGKLPEDFNEVLVSSTIADMYEIGLSSIIEVKIENKNYELIVSGFFISPGQYEYSFLSTLEMARILRPDMVESYSFIEIRSSNTLEVLRALDLSEYGLVVVQGLGMQDYMRSLASEVKRDLYMVSVIIAFLSLISVSHTMYKILGDSMVDIFILRSLGVTKQGIFYVIVLDSIVLCLTGAFFGFIIGNIISNAASLFSFLILRTVFLPVRYDQVLFVYCLLLSLLVGILGGIIALYAKNPVRDAYGVLKTI